MTIHALWANELTVEYKYGYSDCVMTAFRIADMWHGTSYWDKYKGEYDSLMGAQKALAKRGHRTLVDFFDIAFPEKVSPLHCQVGDIAVCDNNGIQHAAVCLGTRFGVKDVDGPKYVMVDEIIAGYRAK